MSCRACEKRRLKVLAKSSEAKKRLKICSYCEHYDRRFGICGVCKCILRLKTALLMSKCPKEKW